jgi:chromosome transmission fidelity protein 4
VTCLAVGADKLVFGSSNQSSFSVGLPELADKNVISRSSLAVHAVTVSKTGGSAAVGSLDGVIKVVDLNNTSQCVNLAGHSGSVLSVAYDPQLEYVASTSADRSVKLWSLATAKCVRTHADWLASIGDPRKSFNKAGVAFSPSGEEVAVCARTTVRFLSRAEKFAEGGRRQLPHSAEVSLCAYSTSGKFLATVALDMCLLVWGLSEREIVAKFKHETYLASLAWHPTANALAVADGDGQFGVWHQPIPEHLGQTVDASATKRPVNAASLFVDDEAGGSATEEELGDMEAGEDEDDPEAEEGFDEAEAERIMSKRPLKKPVTASKKPAPAAKKRAAAGKRAIEEDDDNDMVFDGGAGDDGFAPSAAPAREDMFALSERLKHQEKERRRRLKEEKFEAASLLEEAKTKLSGFVASSQATFQPGATPLGADLHGDKRRFLAWNMLGTITSRDDTVQHSVEIEFFDTAKHRSVRFNDRYAFNIASLSEEGAIFAAPPRADVPATLFYRHFNNWSSSNEWSLQSEAGEAFEAVAAGSTFVAASTSRGMLRVLTPCGVQKFVVSLPGRVIVMAAQGSRLAVILSVAGSPAPRLVVYDITASTFAMRRLHSGDVPVSAACSLTWLGFTDRGVVATVDSAGLVRTLVEEWGWEWSVLVDLKAQRKGSPETCWVTAVLEDSVMGVMLKPDTLAPPVLPRPVPSTIPVRAPLLPHQGIELEEDLIRLRSALDRHTSLAEDPAAPQGSEAAHRRAAATAKSSYDKKLLELLNKACQAGRGERALELAEGFDSYRLVTIAMQLAHANHLPTLAEKMLEQWSAQQRRLERQLEVLYGTSTQQQQQHQHQQHQQQYHDSSSFDAAYAHAHQSALSTSAPASSVALAKATVRTVAIAPKVKKQPVVEAPPHEADMMMETEPPAPRSRSASVENDMPAAAAVAVTPVKKIAANPFAKGSPSKVNPNGSIFSVIDKAAKEKSKLGKTSSNDSDSAEAPSKKKKADKPTANNRKRVAPEAPAETAKGPKQTKLFGM